MTKDELKALIADKERNTYSYLRMLARCKTVEELKRSGYQSFEAALKGIMERAGNEIEKAISKYESENPE